MPKYAWKVGLNIGCEDGKLISFQPSTDGSVGFTMIYSGSNANNIEKDNFLNLLNLNNRPYNEWVKYYEISRDLIVSVRSGLSESMSALGSINADELSAVCENSTKEIL